MAYRVGNQCLETSELAHDYVLSQLPPAVTADGQLIRPVKTGQYWYLGDNQIQLSFPVCDISSQIQFGAMTAAPLLGLVVLIFVFRVLKNLIEQLDADRGNGEDG
ncbi:hypothetical protein [Neisseria musculi]|uniref:hypothetical protein n=1 Tax=Neisseria musculi TaxID=1815583 RepID=UPI00164CCE3D|nr:hypothetical protein [Neisseria musculi]